MRDWPFPRSPEDPVFICSHVQQGGPILEVTHDLDGDWQFLCDADHGEGTGEEPVLVSLGEVVASDDSVAEEAGLVPGWTARRAARGAAWVHEAFPDEPAPASARAVLAEQIEAHGYRVCLVTDAEEDDESPEGDEEREPDFAYTIGLTRSFGQPEVIVFGLPLGVMRSMLQALGEATRSGLPLTAGSVRGDVLEGYDVRLAPVDPSCFGEYLGQAVRYYAGEPFDALQLLWPDRDGSFPDEPSASPSLRAAQPLLAPRP